MQELPKNSILRGYRAFSRVLSKGQKKTHGSIRCFYVAVDGTNAPPRVGFTVARGMRSAARRNRAKRLMREAFRQNKNRVFAEGACIASEIILHYAGTADREIRYRAVENDVVSLLKGLRKKK